MAGSKTWGVLFVGVLVTRALRFGVHIMCPGFLTPMFYRDKITPTVGRLLDRHGGHQLPQTVM